LSDPAVTTGTKTNEGFYGCAGKCFSQARAICSLVANHTLSYCWA
jgi:hypothetical protein